MHISKQQLKQIIKEELRTILCEQVGIEAHPAFIAAQKRKRKERETFNYAFKAFARSLAMETHKGMSGEWIQDLYKTARNSIKKGDYARALKDITASAVGKKLPKVEILMHALESLDLG